MKILARVNIQLNSTDQREDTLYSVVGVESKSYLLDFNGYEEVDERERGRPFLDD